MPTNAHLDIFNTPSHNPSIYAIQSATSYQGQLIDFCVPVNPYFPPPQMLSLIRDNFEDIVKYYPDYAAVHQEHIARLIGIAAPCIVPANGVTELITILCRDAPGRLLTDIPTFGRWTDLPAGYGIPVEYIERTRAHQFNISINQVVQSVRRSQAQMLVLCNPNNPSGAAFSCAEIEQLLQHLSDLPLIIIDESFLAFSEIESAERLAVASANMIVVKSMGKALGWHGIRLGYGVANAPVAESLRQKVPYWNINGLAAFVLKHLHEFQDVYAASFQQVRQDRAYMLQQLKAVRGLTTYPSEANFLLSELPPGISGQQLRNVLLEQHGIFIRECSNKIGASANFIRCAVRKQAEVNQLVAALGDVLSQWPAQRLPKDNQL